MDEQISFGINGDVSIKGTNSIKDLNKQFSDVLETVQTLKEATDELARSASKVNGGKSSGQGLLARATKYNNIQRREQDLFYSYHRHRQNQSYGFSPITNQVSQRRFTPAYDEFSAYNQRRQNSMFALTQYGVRNSDRLNREASDRRIEAMVRKMRFEEKTGITDSMTKEIENYDKVLSELAAKHNEKAWSKIRKDTESAFNKYDTSAKDKYYKQQHDKRVKDRYYREQHNERYNRWENSRNTGNWYTLETGFTMGPNREPYGEGQQLSEKIHQAQRERAELEQKAAEQTREHFRKVSEQSRLLLTADAGIKKAKEENLTSEEELTKEKEQQVEAEKKNTKKTQEMTAYQGAKIDVAKEANKIKADRAATEAAAEARKREQANSPMNQYRNAHPELFAVGALYHSTRYQAGHAFQTLGGVASSLGSGGRAVGLALDSLGAFFKAVPFGIATTISNLAKGITELGKASVQAYSEIEAIKTQLGVVFSNQTQADAMFGNISQYAVKSPFGVQQTSELAVLLKQSGVYASDLMDTLKMLGDTAGGNMEKMKRIANNYAQIVSIGKASMLDMRQFAYAGIPIFEAVSKELGVSQQELRKLISEGKVTADIVEKVFKDLTGINGIFENATEKGAKTLKARLQNLSDARQLAMGSLGDTVVNAGSQYGNDGILTQFVSTAESFFSWMREYNNIQNIERDVNLIATSDTRIKALENLLETAKKTGDKDLEKIIKEELEYQKSVFNVDKRRSIYAESYDIKNEKYNRYKERYGELSDEEISARIQDTQRKLDSLLTTATNQNISTASMFAGSNGLFYNPVSQKIDLSEDAKTQRDVYQNLIKELTEYKAALSAVKKTTEEENKANRERNLINRQQESYDSMDKAAGKEGSYASAFDKLYSLETSSAEYKKKKEEEEIKFLKEAQEALKGLIKFVDDTGRLDPTKLTYSAFSDFYNNKKAFTPDSKLQIVEGNKKATEENRRMLLEQWGDMSDKIFTELEKDNRGRSFRSAQYSQILNGTDDATFFDRFSKVLTEQLAYLDELKKAANSDEMKKYYDDMAENLIASTFRLGVNTKGANANPEDLGTNKQDFIPLWKRIMAQYTGLSTLEMTSAQKTLESYRDDMAVRNMASGVMSAAMKTVGLDSAMKLLSVNGAKQLKEDSSATLQTDWKTTRQNIKDFALSLSATTEVVDAYKKGLEDELDVYEQLIIAGRTQGEDQNGGTSQFISVKKLAQYAQSNEQLVNAFGDTLVTEHGSYKVSDLVVKKNAAGETELYDKLGNKIDDQVMVTDTLTRFLQGELPRLRKELNEANIHSAFANEIERQKNERKEDTVKTFATSAAIIGALKSSNLSGTENLTTRNMYEDSLGYVTSEKLMESFSKIMLEIASFKEVKDFVESEDEKAEKGKETYIGSQGSLLDRANRGNELWEASKEFNKAVESGDMAELSKAMIRFANAMPEKGNALIVEAGANANASLKDKSFLLADSLLRNSPLSISDAMKKDRDIAGNTRFGQTIVDSLKAPKQNFDELLKGMTSAVLLNPSENKDLTDMYTQGILTSIKKGGKKGEFSQGQVEAFSASITQLAESDDFRGMQEFLQSIGREDIWNNATEGANKWALSLGNIGKTLESISDHIEDLAEDFAANAITQTMSTWGKTLATSADDSSEILKNFAQLSANMLSDLGSWITKAGLSLAISSYGDKAGVIAGLSIAAAGGGLSFLGGYINGAINDSEKDKNNSELEKLLKIKQDLTDLLKQAREDAIYYENTTRHKKAISANDEFTTRSVHDAVITPKGEVITTDPKDYLIATKTPKTLVGGGAPTINFSVVDKSTGIRVTQQKSTYNKETNSIDFEAVIESKVQEVIASSKGDDAFAAREARLRGHTVIA